jgi:N-methylhydantoinase A
VVQGATELLDRFGSVIDLAKLQVLGATTVVTNAVLERKGVETGFISTAGFQDMLRIRNEGRYDLYDLNLRYPDPLVTRANSFGAEERMTADGAVVTELKEDTIREIAGHLRSKGIKSVAVCLLHAYKYPKHEQRIAALLRKNPTSSSRFPRKSVLKCASSIAPQQPSSTPTPARRWPATSPICSASSPTRGSTGRCSG